MRTLIPKILMAIFASIFAIAATVSAQYGSISGTTSDAQGGLPIAEAGVSISRIPGIWYTDAEGDYLCDSIADGTYQMSTFNEG